jgi:hypothetical protein
MKTLLALVISLICLCGCVGKQGPTGPKGSQGVQGEQGEQGADGSINVWFYDSVGTLSAPVVETSYKYWFIMLPYPMFDDSLIVQCFVKQPGNFCWVSPKWYYAPDGGVKIIDDAYTSYQGYDFWIQVIYKKNY